MFDHLLKIEALHSRVSAWRALFFITVCFLIFALFQIDYSRLFSYGVPSSLSTGVVARINVDGSIERNKSREALLKSLKRNKAIKAVILQIDSPGGTVGDSEVLYKHLREIAEEKPVVAMLGNVAASGGYMVALAADYIIARNGTITGSIGVLSQYIGVAQLARNLGISLKTIKTSELKAASSPLEDLSSTSEKVLQEVVDDFHRFFVGLVSERRGLVGGELSRVSDGRIYTGMQALKLGLIDEIGGEKEAFEWLKGRDIDTEKLLVRDMDYHRGFDSRGFLSMLGSLMRVALAHFA